MFRHILIFGWFQTLWGLYSLFVVWIYNRCVSFFPYSYPYQLESRIYIRMLVVDIQLFPFMYWISNSCDEGPNWVGFKSRYKKYTHTKAPLLHIKGLTTVRNSFMYRSFRQVQMIFHNRRRFYITHLLLFYFKIYD